MGKKKKVGRPPKRKADKCGEKVTIYLTAEERKRLEKEAREMRLPLSAYLIACWKNRRG